MIKYVTNQATGKPDLTYDGTEVEADVAKLQSDVTALQGDVTDLQTDVLALQTLHVDLKDPTGFVDPANITVTYDSTTRTITLAHASGTVDYYWRGVKKALVSPWISSAHATGDNSFFLYSTDGDNFAWSTTVWTFDHVQVAIAYVAGSVKIAQREVHGLMPWEVHAETHDLLGTYRKSGGTLTAGTYAIQPGSPADADNTPGFDAAVIKDEDLTTAIPAWTQGTYTKLYFTGTGTPVFVTGATTVFRMGTTYPLINSVSGGTFSEVETSTLRYFNVYQLLFPRTADAGSQSYRIVILQPQASFNSYDAANAEDFRALNLGTLTALAPEFVAYARITFVTSASYTGATGRVRIHAVSYLSGSKQTQIAVNGYTPVAASSLQLVDTVTGLTKRAVLSDDALYWEEV